ncbi:TolC family protein [Cryomorphaceae bacterium 1068]|nr:TolC family protein [Cryomorphaceae bacterium 1068]
MNKYVLVGLFLVSATFSQAQIMDTYSLTDVILLARGQSPSSKQAETRLENRYWQYRLYKSNYNPQLALRGNIPGYNRDFLSNRLDDGTIVFQDREQLNSSLNLGLNQPIALTGGNVSVNSSMNYFNDLNQDLTRFNTTMVNIQLDQPIFGFNDLKWDKRTEPLRYEESQRGYVEEMEFISREASGRFFDYLSAQINYEIAQFNLLNNDTIYKIEQGRYNIGTTSKDKLLQVELQLLRSQQDVSQALLDLETSSLQLRSYLGLNNADTIFLNIPDGIPEFEISLQDALVYAKMNRSDYIAFERQRIEASREVAQARAQRFQVNLSASYGLNSASSMLDEAYQDPNDQQRFDVGLIIPILDWGRNKARMQTALANRDLSNFVIDQDIQNFEQEIITLVRRFDVLRQQLVISKKSDEVAAERYNVAQNRYLTGKVDITNLNIALSEKDAAKRSYVTALRDFWIAYFDLRRLTLYDFAAKDLLYKPEEED